MAILDSMSTLNKLAELKILIGDIYRKTKKDNRTPSYEEAINIVNNLISILEKPAPFIRVKYERLLRGWPQKYVASKVKVPQSNLCGVENGNIKPWKKIRERLSFLYGISEEELFKPIELKDEKNR